MKHTKGEWKVTQKHEGKIVVFAPDQLRIAGTFDLEEGRIYHNYDECLANAKLIAAAPDLLEALEIIASNSNDSVIIKVAIKAINKAKS